MCPTFLEKQYKARSIYFQVVLTTIFSYLRFCSQNFFNSAAGHLHVYGDDYSSAVGPGEVLIAVNRCKVVHKCTLPSVEIRTEGGVVEVAVYIASQLIRALIE